jgi:hypothetical protein
LVIAVHDGRLGLVRAIQRVLLNPDGSAIRDSRGKRMKLSLGPIKGNSARCDFWPDPKGRWGLAEGPESALAAYQLTGIPTWAAISGGNMTNIEPPSWARHAVVFADHDDAGKSCAVATTMGLRKRGLDSVRIVASPDPGADPADVIREAANA